MLSVKGKIVLAIWLIVVGIASALGLFFAIFDSNYQIKQLDKLIETEPNNHSAYWRRGVSKVLLKQYFEAIKDFDQAIKLSPKDALAYVDRGSAKIYVKEYVEAIKDLDTAIELGHKYKGTYNLRGKAKYYLEHYSDAIADYNKAIELYPPEAESYRLRGEAKLSLSQFSDAITDFDTAITLKSKYLTVYSRFGPEYAMAYELRAKAKDALGLKASGEEDRAIAKKLRGE